MRANEKDDGRHSLKTNLRKSRLRKEEFQQALERTRSMKECLVILSEMRTDRAYGKIDIRRQARVHKGRTRSPSVLAVRIAEDSVMLLRYPEENASVRRLSQPFIDLCAHVTFLRLDRSSVLEVRISRMEEQPFQKLIM
eukprot:gene6581-12124_t